MIAGRKRWWRAAALAAVGGGVIAGGWFGFVRATAPPTKPEANTPIEEPKWTRAATPAPSVAEVGRAPADMPGAVVPAGATLPIPATDDRGPVFPTVAATPPIILPPAPIHVPAAPPSSLPTIEPVAGPRVPDAGLIPADSSLLPVVPAMPAIEVPKPPAVKKPEPLPMAPVVPPTPVPVPVPVPALPEVKPVAPMMPPPSDSTAEPPKAPKALPVPPAPVDPLPKLPDAPVMPLIPPMDAVVPSPLIPVKPNSDLLPPKPHNTLNPMALPGAQPLPTPMPVLPPAPGAVVDRPKPKQPPFPATAKDVFPLPTPDVPPLTPIAPTPRDPAMFKFKQAAALAILGGAMLTAEQAKLAAAQPAPPKTKPDVPAIPVKADTVDTAKLKTDLEEANRKIAALEKKVTQLNELLTGKKDETGVVIPTDPGAVEQIKQLTDKLAALEKELKAVKTQTSLKPAVTVPEVKSMGVVKVINEYPVEISMVINNKSYRVAPNSVVDIKVPVGEFSYQLLQSGAPTTKSVIGNNETVRLRIK